RKYFQNNVEAALTLLNTAMDAGVRRFVFSSTCAVYGTPDKVPMTEDAVRRPINPYGISKLFFENALESYDRAYGLRFAILRYFNAAGADEIGGIGVVHDPESHLITLVFDAIRTQGKVITIFSNEYSNMDATIFIDIRCANDI